MTYGKRSLTRFSAPGATVLVWDSPLWKISWPNTAAGSGTIFKIYLPVIEEATDEEAGDAPETMAEGGTETILLVDDEPFICDLGKQILTRFGYTVLTAADGESALALYREKKACISLVILDLIMPGMGGQRCLEKLLHIDPGAKIIIVSGYSAEIHQKESIETGACGFIRKPYEIKQMLGVVREALNEECQGT